jgi:hypothetical protein
MKLRKAPTVAHAMSSLRAASADRALWLCYRDWPWPGDGRPEKNPCPVLRQDVVENAPTPFPPAVVRLARSAGVAVACPRMPRSSFRNFSRDCWQRITWPGLTHRRANSAPFSSAGSRTCSATSMTGTPDSNAAAASRSSHWTRRTPRRATGLNRRVTALRIGRSTGVGQRHSLSVQPCACELSMPIPAGRSSTT